MEPLFSEKQLQERYDLNLSTKTMANWINLCAGRYLQPVYDLMKVEFLRSKYVQGDETLIQVIDEPEQKGTTQNWRWVYLTDENSESPRMVLFKYERARGGMLYKIEEMIRGKSPEEKYTERQRRRGQHDCIQHNRNGAPKRTQAL